MGDWVFFDFFIEEEMVFYVIGKVFVINGNFEWFWNYIWLLWIDRGGYEIWGWICGILG